MDQDKRKELLKKFSGTAYADAVEDYLEEQIKELNSVTNLPADNVEVHAAATMKAIQILKKILHKIVVLKKVDDTTKNNDYI
jgi:hypothetical protein